jgi:hypothetical protein
MKINQIKNLSSVSLASLMLVCGTATLRAGDTNALAAAEKSPQVVAVKDLIKDADKLDGQEVVLQGFVTDYCKRKGCWATLHDADAEAKGLVKVQQDEEGSTFKPFLPELQGKTILVTGKVHATKIDADYLDKWEARVKSAKSTTAAEAERTADADKAKDATLKQIAVLRERVAKSKNGYLSSISLAVNTWEPKPEQP